MNLNLNDKIAIVTGASKGIGLTITEGLAREGGRVIAASREVSEALATLAKNYEVRPFQVDLGTPQGPAQLVEYCVRQLGKPDILVNNVGNAVIHLGGFLATTDEDWQRSLELNLLSMVRVTRAALPHMLEGGSGAIVNISSVNAHQPGSVITDYSAAKAGITNLTKALAEEFGPKGIRVNSVSPGPVRTSLQVRVADALSGVSGVKPESLIEQAPQRNNITLGRFIEPQEVADLVLFLASERAAIITGVDYIIDGGMLKTI
jgi:NAD(P)-dependent dehydrogenase (short-subunit alcohol dehydrogenase family)